MDPRDQFVSSPGAPASEAARIAMTDDAVLALLRQHFTGVDSMYLCPSVPGKKELAARAVHARHLHTTERVLALFDDTVFGSGDDGFLVTARRLCWKNVAGRPNMIEWRELDPDRMYAERRKLILGTGAIEISSDEPVVEACEQAFHVLAFSARAQGTSSVSGYGAVQSSVVQSSEATAAAQATASGVVLSGAARLSDRPTYRPQATPPPPHAVTYASYVTHASSQKSPKFSCWHCHTPLHWNTPQCAHCSALPAAQGWQRTG